MKAETSEKSVALSLVLSQRQASRLAADTERMRDALLQDKREREFFLEASVSGEYFLARKRY